MKNIIWIEQNVSTGVFLSETLPHAANDYKVFLATKDTPQKRSYIEKSFSHKVNKERFIFLYFRFIPYLFYIYVPFLIFHRLYHERKDTHFILVESSTLSTISGIILKLLIRRPLVLRLGILPYEYGKHRKKNTISRLWFWLSLSTFLFFAYRGIDYFIVDNQIIANEVKKYRKNATIFIVLPYGINAAVFLPASSSEKQRIRDALSLHGAKIVGVYGGRLSPEKGGILHLLELSDYLRERGILLCILGHGSLQEAVAAEVRKRNARHIVLKGYIPDRKEVAGYIRAADFYIQPSLAEGMGIAPLEAMACKTPVISTKVGGLSLTIDENRAFVIENPNKPEAYRTAVENFLNAPSETILRKVENAYEFVQKNFTQEKIESEWRKILVRIA